MVAKRFIKEGENYMSIRKPVLIALLIIGIVFQIEAQPEGSKVAGKTATDVSKNELTTPKNEVTDLKKQIDNLDKRITQLENENKHLQEKRDKAIKQNTQFIQQISALTKKYSELEDSMRELKDRYQQLEGTVIEKIQPRLATLEGISAQLSKNTDTNIHETYTQIREELKSYQQKIAHLNSILLRVKVRQSIITIAAAVLLVVMAGIAVFLIRHAVKKPCESRKDRALQEMEKAPIKSIETESVHRSYQDETIAAYTDGIKEFFQDKEPVREKEPNTEPVSHAPLQQRQTIQSKQPESSGTNMALLYRLHQEREKRRERNSGDSFLTIPQKVFNDMYLGIKSSLILQKASAIRSAQFIMTKDMRLYVNFYVYNENTKVDLADDVKSIWGTIFTFNGKISGYIKDCKPATVRQYDGDYKIATKGMLILE